MSILLVCTQSRASLDNSMCELFAILLKTVRFRDKKLRKKGNPDDKLFSSCCTQFNTFAKKNVI